MGACAATYLFTLRGFCVIIELRNFSASRRGYENCRIVQTQKRGVVVRSVSAQGAERHGRDQRNSCRACGSCAGLRIRHIQRGRQPQRAHRRSRAQSARTWHGAACAHHLRELYAAGSAVRSGKPEGIGSRKCACAPRRQSGGGDVDGFSLRFRPHFFHKLKRLRFRRVRRVLSGGAPGERKHAR